MTTPLLRKVRWLIILSIVFLFITEIFLRSYFGFCDTVLMQEDSDYEYIAQPNQKRNRFRKQIQYNSHSMRGEEIDSLAVRILGFGDSILNGGALTDQDSLATTLLSQRITKLRQRKTQFLNISAGSWGPDNCMAYLKKHGNFGGKEIFLFVSSHDAYDNMSFEKVVGNNVNFPSTQYSSAIYELIDRYLIPRLQEKFPILQKEQKTDKLGINKQTPYAGFNPGFAQFVDYARANNVELTMYLHAERSEVENKAYNEQGQKIIQFANANGVTVLKDLEHGLTPAHFRDAIHLNEKGQAKMADIVFDHFQKNRKQLVN